MRITVALVGCWLALPASIQAQGAAPDGADEDESRLQLLSPHGMSLTLGGGATKFIGPPARDLMGGERLAYYGELRLAYGTRARFAGELAFTRSGPALSKEQRRSGAPEIFGHTFEGLLRLNHPQHAGSLFYSPFVVAGVGWTDFRPADDREPATPAYRLDRAGTVPLGLGIAASYRVLYGEARLWYRPTFGVSALGAGGAARPSLQAWSAGLAAGVEF
jgi:hypothetical protein